MKFDRRFAKPDLKQDGSMDWAPIPLRVITHHHEEWDEPVYDPETGEPVIDPDTGEQKTEHMSRDWDTAETRIKPIASECRQMGYIDVIDKAPSSDPPAGKHYDPLSYELMTLQDGSREWVMQYGLVDDPPPPPRRFSVKKVAVKIKDLGYTAQVREALMAANAYEMFVGANYLRDDDEDFLAMRGLVQQVTGLTDSQIEEVLSECIWEEG